MKKYNILSLINVFGRKEKDEISLQKVNYKHLQVRETKNLPILNNRSILMIYVNTSLYPLRVSRL